MTLEQAEELYKILETKVGTEEETKEDVAKQLRHFMRKHHLPFLATDRSVLNLPAIGKSMTFQLVGLTEEGNGFYASNMTALVIIAHYRPDGTDLYCRK